MLSVPEDLTRVDTGILCQVAVYSEDGGTPGGLVSWHRSVVGVLWKSLGLAIDALDAGTWWVKDFAKSAHSTLRIT